ncbi:MAG: DUF4124 domain-containing protein [Burkholderiaceae bacterium]
MTKSCIAFMLAAFVVASCVVGSSWSAAYRCEADGRTIYSDKPCSAGQQSEVAIDASGPSAEDRATAAARLRSDKATAKALQRDREKRERGERTERVSTRAGSDRAKEVNACTKLAVRARRAHEDYNAAGPREQAKKRVRMMRAEEDYAALCKKR